VESGDLESRVSALEEQVLNLTGRVQSTEQDAAAARVLAGAADRDVSEFRSEVREFRRATTASFDALRQDFVDLRQDFVDLRQDFVDLRAHVDDGFVEMRGKFDVMAAGQHQIVDLLQTIITDQGRGGTTD
jgi:uncharacterized protein YceH (UPF0502 family)